MSKEWGDILRFMALTLIFGLIIIVALCRINRLEKQIQFLENAPADTVFIERVYTVLYDNPTLIEKYESEKEKVAIEMRRLKKQLAEILNLPPDTVAVHDTTEKLVFLPREYMTYKDSSYRAVVSGVDPRLDSIEVYQKVRTEYITKTIIKREPTRWGVGAHIGVGLVKDKVQPYIGVGVQYNFITW